MEVLIIMLKTIHGDKSLLLWKQNRNGANILQPVGDTSYDDFIKENIYMFFKELRKSFEKNNKYSFCAEWVKLWEGYWKTLEKNVSAFFNTKDKNKIKKVVTKIKGNIGEIFAELFFTVCGAKWISPSTYEPVDPTNERFTDASALDPLEKVKCGIQVKNYASEIPSEVFWKAGSEDRFALESLPPELIECYMKRRRQFIFSFTGAAFSPILEDFKTFIEMIGPKEIDRELENNDFRLDLLDKLLNEF